MVKRIFKGTIGETVSLTLDTDAGTPVDLTSSTVTATWYNTGSNASKFVALCSVTDATNGLAFYTIQTTATDTAGMFYSVINVAYDSGDVTKVTDEQFEVYENQENLVTVSEFLGYIDIPADNAISTDAIKSYLEGSESTVNQDIPDLANSTNSDYIKLKKKLIILKSAIKYFMNLGENFINPDIRISKINMWKEEYNNSVDMFMSTLSSTSESGTGLIRRVKNSDYSDSSSYLYED